MSPTNEEQDAKDQAVEYVVDEAKSWATGAPEETVKDKLQEGLSEAEVDLPSEQVDELAAAIHEGEDAEPPAAQ